MRLRGSKCQVDEYIQVIQESLVKSKSKVNEIPEKPSLEEAEDEANAKLWRKFWKKLVKNLHHFRRQGVYFTNIFTGSFLKTFFHSLREIKMRMLTKQ